MSLDKATVAKVANLARIRVEEEKLEPLAAELNAILGWVEQLGEVDTENVPPMTSVADMKLRWRQDEITDGGYQEQVVANAPAKEDGFFAVPKVIE
ncbi:MULTISPECIES: Asp-tRNA(Asn)/Glu-tRNA(Gln) amidotransferase subunit GatC [Sneathiella]|jgi:aspartyl-tRNA(Asn)/glutamyl-tRNA(Gln) amidotransferase subunit C|uniref:Asp-tRNA(Asn)/Glu-tRNA(Gln) amidotransferase subunit GatC n=1 Tax=Sneathiella TaxID=510690 RepID=UPI00146DBE0E|nr:Asp-tRNA(Asn)/Glu-tRNA(Gln) amidotransferase subunit GatC [Sneathiella aquimaris]